MRVRATLIYELVLLGILVVPILGTFFPLESYLAAPTVANPMGTPVSVTVGTTLVIAVVSILIFSLYAMSPAVMIPALVRNWPILAFVGWAFVTATWAEIPGLSFNRTGRLLIGCLFAIYLSEALDLRSLVRLLCYGLLIGILASILVTVAYPSLSRVTDVRGAWRGAFGHKNSTGTVAAFGLMFACYAYATRAVWRPLLLVLFAGSATMLLLSNSATALLALIIAASVAGYLYIFAVGRPEGRLFAIAAALAGAGFLAVLSASLGGDVEIAGRSSTLTGRTDVWNFANLMIEREPVWGYGHGAWNMPTFAEAVKSELKWPAPHAHNSWLDFRLQLGLPGLVLAAFIWLLLYQKLVHLTLIARDPQFLIWVAVSLLLSLRSMTETIMVDPSSGEIFWFTLAYANLRRLLLHARRRPLQTPVYEKTRPALDTPPAARYP